MPCFNERGTVEAAVAGALESELPVDTREVVLVDDGSTDGTDALLRERDWPDTVKVVFHDHNRGKGAAVRTALAHASGEYAAILDADLVFGTRAWSAHTAFSFWYVVGNKAVTLATNVIYNCWISDVMTCHKAM